MAGVSAAVVTGYRCAPADIMRCTHSVADLTSPARFFLLDVSRGVAAMVVVLGHFSHFHRYPSHPSTEFATKLWFVEWLWPFYAYSGYAVQYFFVLSGFIFYEYYYEAVRSRKVSALAFFVLRFSRLYPLHLASLVIVALLQAWTLWRFGDFFIYQSNDAYHFLLQLAFASNWGLEGAGLKGSMDYSFNGPIWSVSLEVLAYIAFFLVARFLPRRLLGVLGISLLSFIMARYAAIWIGMVLACFFSGGLASETLRLATRSGRRPLIAGVIVVATVSMGAALLAIRFVPGFDRIASMVIWGVVFPALVLVLAGLQWLWTDSGKGLRLLGDITYASYLTHFPIQLVMAPIFFVVLGNSSPNAALLGAYLTITILVSLCVYQFFEMPAQSLLRRLMLRDREKPQARSAITSG